MREHRTDIDLIRILACVMVVAMHSALPASETTASDTYLLAPLSYLTAPCIGLFFMVSGSLLLPLRSDSRTFLKRRLLKIAVPTFVWTLFYIAVHVIVSGEEVTPFIVESLVCFPFCAHAHGVFWFIYVLIGLYLLVPVLTPWWNTASRREIEAYLCLWLVSLCYPYLRLFIDIPSGEVNVLYYFSGYAGYFVLGAYMEKYRDSMRLKIRNVALLMILVSFIIPLIVTSVISDIDFYELFWYLSISVAVMCAFCYMLLGKFQLVSLNVSLSGILTEISRMTFGVYLVHIFVLRTCLWKVEMFHSLPYILQIPLFTILTMSISCLIVKLLSFSRYSKYIIGY